VEEPKLLTHHLNEHEEVHLIGVIHDRDTGRYYLQFAHDIRVPCTREQAEKAFRMGKQLVGAITWMEVSSLPTRNK